MENSINTTTSPFLFELSGEHDSLPKAEAIACAEAESSRSNEVSSGPGYTIIEIEKERITDVGARIALTHRIGPYLGSCDPGDLDDFLASLELPDGTVAVRAKRFEKNRSELDLVHLMRRCGARLSEGRKVDLVHPDVPVRVLVSDRLHFFLDEIVVDRKQFDLRKVGERPFFSPISLHPRYARTLVNLTRVRKGQTLLDPFCGTGGVLIEAAMVGARAMGSDIAEDMVEGCTANMRHFDTHLDRIERADIGDIASTFGKVDVIATDPPYGRSASTKREGRDSLYDRAMTAMVDVVREGGRIGVVFPQPMENGWTDLMMTESFKQRVHGSLSRHYYLFSKIA